MSLSGENAWRVFAFLPQELRNQFIVWMPVDGPEQVMLRAPSLHFKLGMARERLEEALKTLASTLSSRTACHDAAELGLR